MVTTATSVVEISFRPHFLNSNLIRNKFLEKKWKWKILRFQFYIGNAQCLLSASLKYISFTFSLYDQPNVHIRDTDVGEDSCCEGIQTWMVRPDMLVSCYMFVFVFSYRFKLWLSIQVMINKYFYFLQYILTKILLKPMTYKPCPWHHADKSLVNAELCFCCLCYFIDTYVQFHLSTYFLTENVYIDYTNSWT